MISEMLQQHIDRSEVIDTVFTALVSKLGEPTQNGYAERLMRTIKEEEVDLSGYRNFMEAYVQIKTFLEDVSMRKRIHSSIEYLTPIEFKNEWKDKQ